MLREPIRVGCEVPLFHPWISITPNTFFQVTWVFTVEKNCSSPPQSPMWMDRLRSTSWPVKKHRNRTLWCCTGLELFLYPASSLEWRAYYMQSLVKSGCLVLLRYGFLDQWVDICLITSDSDFCKTSAMNISCVITKTDMTHCLWSLLN